jgi:hypothetical protein
MAGGNSRMEGAKKVAGREVGIVKASPLIAIKTTESPGEAINK